MDGKPRRSAARVGKERRERGSRWCGPGPSQGRTRHRRRECFVVASLCERLTVGQRWGVTPCWPTHSSTSGEGEESLLAAKRPRRKMARAESLWSDEEALSQFEIDVARCAKGGGADPRGQVARGVSPASSFSVKKPLGAKRMPFR